MSIVGPQMHAAALLPDDGRVLGKAGWTKGLDDSRGTRAARMVVNKVHADARQV